MINEKKLLRKKYKEIRSSIGDYQKLSDDIFRLFINSGFYDDADVIFTYWSMDREVCTHNLIRRALYDGKKVALPKCVDKEGNMKFYFINSLEDLSVGMYGIMEPSDKFPADIFGENSVCVVPGLSFDNYGFRLGYGKGYYDRFLNSFSGIAVGFCYDECIAELLPRNEFDKKVDYIITNKKIYDLR